MTKLPETTAEMLPDDFEGIAEALKGTGTKHDHGEHCIGQWGVFKIRPLYQCS